MAELTSSSRLRFAPSPTGFLHVGGARTALYNYLLARKHGGTFVLRIEDTDRERSSEEMTRAIVDALAWLGLQADEGPYHQADGLARHRRAAESLLASGAAYRCFCTPEELERQRREARDRGRGFGYDGRCRRLDPADAAARATGGETFAVRFAVPPGATSWEDLVHGERSSQHDHIDDFVILRSDATPVYNLAVVSDDIEMRITHVLRGDDHLSNTPKQIMLYRALGAEPPAFGHLPMILGTDGRRLSKRHGALAVEAYRDLGILPGAMVNFLALLGWSPGDDREVMELAELVDAFSLDRVLKKSAVFDPEKLWWLNGEQMRRADLEQLGAAVEARLIEDGSVTAESLDAERERWLAVVDLVRERGRTLHELADQAAPFFTGSVEYEEAAVRRFWKDPERAAALLRDLRELFEGIPSWEPGALEEGLRGLAERVQVRAGQLIHPLRVALMGVAVSPGIFAVLELMGRERTLERIERALGWLDAKAAAEA